MRYDLDNDTYVAYTHSGGQTYNESEEIGSLTQQSASETSAMTPLVAGTVRSHMRPGSNAFDVVAAPLLEALRGGANKVEQAVSVPGSAVRRLTPTECARLQGFPDDWLGTPNEKPDSPRYAALGDAVTVNVAEWIGRKILEAEAA